MRVEAAACGGEHVTGLGDLVSGCRCASPGRTRTRPRASGRPSSWASLLNSPLICSQGAGLVGPALLHESSRPASVSANSLAAVDLFGADQALVLELLRALDRPSPGSAARRRRCAPRPPALSGSRCAAPPPAAAERRCECRRGAPCAHGHADPSPCRRTVLRRSRRTDPGRSRDGGGDVVRDRSGLDRLSHLHAKTLLTPIVKYRSTLTIYRNTTKTSTPGIASPEPPG